MVKKDQIRNSTEPQQASKLESRIGKAEPRNSEFYVCKLLIPMFHITETILFYYIVHYFVGINVLITMRNGLKQDRI